MSVRTRRRRLSELAGRKAPRGVLHETASRRMFLAGTGAMLALPVLESLWPRGAAAQMGGGVRRFVCFKSFSTQITQSFYPSFEGNGYTLKNAVYSGDKADGTTLLTTPLGGGPYTQAPLRDLETDAGLSEILGPGLNPWLDKLTLIRGLDFLPAVNHNFGGLLGNYASCTNATPCDADALPDIATIDQVLAYSSRFYPQAPAVRALHISQGVEDAMSFTDYGDPGGRVDQMKARTNPRDVWNDVFASLGEVAPEGNDAPQANPDALLVDRVIEQYRALRDSPRLSGEDREKLERHVALLTEIEARLGGSSSGGGGATMSCVKPMEAAALQNNAGTDPGDITAKWDAFLELAVLAMACDRTRLVTLAIHKALGPGPDPNDTTPIGHFHSENASGGTWHGLAHDMGNPNARRMLVGINRWIAESLFAKLLEKMDAVKEEGGRSLLDNSLVYWGNELGFNHIAYSVPCVLAGSAGGFIEPGRYLDYIDWDGRSYFAQEGGNVIKGIPHNRLLVTVLQAMGLEPGDYERGGQPGYGSTDTRGKNASGWPLDYDMSKIGEILPGI